jgi:hypothetical protein
VRLVALCALPAVRGMLQSATALTPHGEGIFMNKMFAVAALALFTLATSAHAADAAASAPKATAQQNRMGQCNQEAGDKKGDERKAFMKTCLSAKKQTQQDKMRTCNKEATGKTGDDRRTFMKTCLAA